MKHRNGYKWIGVILAVSMLAGLLAGCENDFISRMLGPTAEQLREEQQKKEKEAAAERAAEMASMETVTRELTSEETIFTLRWSSEDSMNPIYSHEVNNDVVLSLIYEPFFRLDNSFRAVPVLCTGYETQDGLRYKFDIRSTPMHDGSYLTADDVVYSLNLARVSSRYGSRLSNISYCFVNDDGQAVVDLYSVDYDLITLLDVPIIKSGSGEARHPAGTGPYQFFSIGSYNMLKAFSDYRDAASVSQNLLFLAEYADSELEESFFLDALDLVWEDAGTSDMLNMHGDYEARYYNTSILQYIGFSSNRECTLDPNIRKAISYAVNRAQIIEKFYNGKAVEAPLVLSPECYLYDESWVTDTGYSMAKVSEYLAAAGMGDFNSDGYLEYPIYGSWQTLTLRFLVYSGNQKKVKAARSIADTLARVGLHVEVKTAGWNDYLYFLNEGEYDMYFGEIALTHNFDLSRLLGKDGSASYGGVTSEAYTQLCRAVKEAQTESERKAAWEALCRQAEGEMPIIPILFRDYAVMSHRGVITGLEPTVSGVFPSVTEWTINLETGGEDDD